LLGRALSAALPRRVFLNVDPSDFTDENGRQIPAWKVAAGAGWAIPPATDEEGRRIPASEGDRPQVIQFTSSDLNNYATVMKQIATLAGSKFGLPPHYMGYSSENPASADAIRSSEARLVKRAERKQRGYGGSWEQAMRIALVLMGRDPNEASRLETIWRDASTPTAAAKADRTVKLVQAGVIDIRQAQEDLGYTKTQIQNMLDRSNSARGQTSNILAGLRNLNVAQGAATGADPAANPAAPPASPAGTAPANDAAA